MVKWFIAFCCFTDFHPSKQSLPFLPKSPKCLKTGQLAKVIAKTGRVVVGRIRYCGPVASIDSDDIFVGLQLPNALGDCDGSLAGKKFFEWWEIASSFQENNKLLNTFFSYLTATTILEFLCHSKKSSWRGTRKFVDTLKNTLD